MAGFALLLIVLMQPPRLALALVFPSLLSLLSPPPLPYRIAAAALTLARLCADGLIRGLTIVRRPHFFHLPCPPLTIAAPQPLHTRRHVHTNR